MEKRSNIGNIQPSSEQRDKHASMHWAIKEILRHNPGSNYMRYNLLFLCFCLVSGSVLGGCEGDTAPDDTIKTCTNCLFNQCCLDGVCVDGTTSQQCGSHGNACKTCQSGPCTDGYCKAVECGPLNCPDGCCSITGCVTPVGELACGSNGSACEACETNELCVDGTCSGPLASSYKVKVVAAMVSNDACTDNCDTIIEVAIASRNGTFSTESAPEESWTDTDRPTWDFVLFTGGTWELSTHPLKVSVIDDDVGPSTLLGRCELPISYETLIEGTLTSACGESGDVELVSFRFEPVES